MSLKSIITNWKRLFYRKFCAFFHFNPTQILTLKLTPNSNSNLNLLTLKKANEKSADKYLSFLFYSH